MRCTYNTRFCSVSITVAVEGRVGVRGTPRFAAPSLGGALAACSAAARSGVTCVVTIAAKIISRPKIQISKERSSGRRVKALRTNVRQTEGNEIERFRPYLRLVSNSREESRSLWKHNFVADLPQHRHQPAYDLLSSVSAMNHNTLTQIVVASNYKT